MEPYAVYAIRYGSHERTAAQNFIGGDAPRGRQQPRLLRVGS